MQVISTVLWNFWVFCLFKGVGIFFFLFFFLLWWWWKCSNGSPITIFLQCPFRMWVIIFLCNFLFFVTVSKVCIFVISPYSCSANHFHNSCTIWKWKVSGSSTSGTNKCFTAYKINLFTWPTKQNTGSIVSLTTKIIDK